MTKDLTAVLQYIQPSLPLLMMRLLCALLMHLGCILALIHDDERLVRTTNDEVLARRVALEAEDRLKTTVRGEALSLPHATAQVIAP